MSEHYNVLVVGAGPAGLAAARVAASHGVRVGMLDAQPRAGGQVWRHDVAQRAPRLARRAMRAALHASRVSLLAQTRVVAAQAGALLVESAEGSGWIKYDRLILATGARELLLPFPGWTLPGVTGAGGLQALAKQGWPLTGKRVLVAGSGPLLLATAVTARRHGAKVVGVHEQLSVPALARFGAGLWRWPGKPVQAVGLRARLAGVPYRAGTTVLRALGEKTLRAVEVEDDRGRHTLDCEQLAVGYGLLPNIELAQLLGCAMNHDDTHPAVRVDACQRTSLEGVLAAGEICGIGGRDVALIEGAIAGHMAVGAIAKAETLQDSHRRARAFAAHLQRHFVFDPRLRERIKPDTLVCRCEDVPWKAVADHTDARSAKLATRCGMGACQGRICGSALAALGQFPRSGLRASVTPARLDTLATPFPSIPQPAAASADSGVHA